MILTLFRMPFTSCRYVTQEPSQTWGVQTPPARRSWRRTPARRGLKFNFNSPRLRDTNWHRCTYHVLFQQLNRRDLGQSYNLAYLPDFSFELNFFKPTSFSNLWSLTHDVEVGKSVHGPKMSQLRNAIKIWKFWEKKDFVNSITS